MMILQLNHRIEIAYYIFEKGKRIKKIKGDYNGEEYSAYSSMCLDMDTKGSGYGHILYFNSKDAEQGRQEHIDFYHTPVGNTFYGNIKKFLIRNKRKLRLAH